MNVLHTMSYNIANLDNTCSNSGHNFQVHVYTQNTCVASESIQEHCTYTEHMQHYIFVLVETITFVHILYTFK